MISYVGRGGGGGIGKGARWLTGHGVQRDMFDSDEIFPGGDGAGDAECELRFTCFAPPPV